MASEPNWSHFSLKWWQNASILCLLFAILLISLHSQNGYFLKKIDNYFFDQVQLIKPRLSSNLPVFVVTIDEKAIKDFGQWPWPRNIIADLINKLNNDYEVRAIGMDIIFAEKDRFSPINFPHFSNANSEGANGDRNLLDYDKILTSEILTAGNVVLPIVLSSGTGSERPPPRKVTFNLVGKTALSSESPYMGRLANLRNLEMAAKGLGVINSVTDYDGVVRDTALVSILTLKGAEDALMILPSFSTEILRVFMGTKNYLIKESRTGKNLLLRLEKFVTEMNYDGSARIYYSRFDKKKFISVSEILSGNRLKDLKGAAVLVGITAEGLRDKTTTPLDQNVPGIEVHRQVLENILTGSFLERSKTTIAFEILSALIIMLVIGIGCVWLGPIASATTGIVIGCVAVVFCWLAFAHFGVLISPVSSILSSIGTWIIFNIFGRIAENNKRRYITEAFGRYVSPDYVNDITNSPEQLALGGRSKDLTFLFCDIRGFTQISEAFRDKPELLLSLLNDILEPLTEIILRNKGTVDKYLGDGIMAFWNAPLESKCHAELALKTAFDMLLCVQKKRNELSGSDEYQIADLSKLSIGIGVNTGIATVGNIGSKHRFDYSVIGDAVNLTARLEGQCKNYKVDNVISEYTLHALKLAGLGDIIDPDIKFLPLDCVKVVGKNISVRIYTLVSNKGSEADMLTEKHNIFFEQYIAGNFPEAILVLKDLIEARTNLRNFYKFMVERCQNLNNEGVENWQGFYELTTK